MKARVLLCLVGAVTLIGCITDMTPFEHGLSDSSRKALIASEQTAFKEQLVANVVDTLGSSWYVKVVGLGDLETESTDQYTAIVLITAMRGGKLDGRVFDYLTGDPSDDRVLVYYTRGTEDPLPERYVPVLAVDSISSASRDGRTAAMVTEIVAFVQARDTE